MRILLAGGGSGGHVTPLRVVADEIESIRPGTKITLLTDRGYTSQVREIFADYTQPYEYHQIFAGKLRRYSHKPWWWHFIHLPTLLLNLRDALLVIVGVVQSWWILRRTRPNAIFCKGGFVCLPIGLMAYFYKIPLILHDSDTVPGLTNRVLARWATAIAVGTSTDNYHYPSKLVYETGVPISPKFSPVSQADRQKIRASLKLMTDLPLLLVVGGGTGARNLNQVVASQARALVDKCEIVHLTGVGKSREVSEIIDKTIIAESALPNYHVLDFTGKLDKYLKAADLIVSRAGATAIEEVAAIGKPMIVVPGRQLSGGHQISNAKRLAQAKAAIVFDEEKLQKNSEILSRAIRDLLGDKSRLKSLASNLHKLHKSGAAQNVARLIIDNANGNKLR